MDTERPTLLGTCLAVAASIAAWGCATGGTGLRAAGPAGADAAGSGAALAQADRVSANGTYQTSFAIPAPAAPAAPTVILGYDSGASGSLAGVGWDLSVGWPMSMSRDVRFGTPRWMLDAEWLWGSTPLVRMNPKDPDCADRGWCRYRLAPEAMAEVSIDLTAGPARAPGATVRLPTGTTLEYEPILYDGALRPPAPAGAQTGVFGFRLVSTVDRNGYRSCFRYAAPPADNPRGQVEPLVEIAYGPAPPNTATCADVFSNSSRHRVIFEYTPLRQAGYFSSWTNRFGAPASFDHVLTKIDVYANGLELQDEYVLDHAGASTTETRRPLLSRILHTVPVPAPPGQQAPLRATKVVRTFAYGRRSPTYGGAEAIDIGELGSFPPALAGTVSRPVRRASLLENTNGMFQTGQDQDTDSAPPSHATTEQWAFMDLNGDGLPDFQWGREKGIDPARQWLTFEENPSPFGTTVTRSDRTVQQKIVINHGVSNRRLATSGPNWISSSAPSLEADYAPVPTSRSAIPTQSFTNWIWGEGRGLTRTGMPVSISAGEIANQVAACPRDRDQDPRRWPLYPDGTSAVSKGSVGMALSQLDVRGLEDTLNAGNPVLTIIKGIHDGYRPTHGVSATVSGWADLTGDGLPEFVATPGWIERFSIEPLCVTWTDPGNLILRGIIHTVDSEFANNPQPTTDTAGRLDTRWHYSGLLSLPSDGTTLGLDLAARSGPPGPVSLPLTYETTTSTSEGRGFTLPVGSLVSTGISTILTPGWKWIPIAAAAPGLTIDSAAPHNTGGFALSIPAPSASAVLQGLGSTAYGAAKSTSGADAAGSIAGFIMSVVRVNFDFTIVSTTTRSRSESRAQLMDVNADGLPDYLLYASGCAPTGTSEGCITTGTQEDGTPVLAPPGSLLAYLNTAGGFASGPPLLLNSGFAYPTPPPSLPAIERSVQTLRKLVNELTSPLLLFPDQRCLGSVLACLDYLGSPFPPVAAGNDQGLFGIVRTASEIAADAALQSFLDQDRDLTPAERGQMGEIRTLRDSLRAQAIAIAALVPTALPVPLISVATATVTAQTLSETVGQFALTVHHVGHASRINVPSQGFAMLGGGRFLGEDPGTPFWEHADGISAQTRGLVDLNGDGLPDYVNTDDRETECGANQWQVFWSTGTSSASAGRGFLGQADCIDVPPPPALDVEANGYHTLPLNVDRVRRKQTNNATDVDTVVNSFVSLLDVNLDGRPDIVIAGDSWDPDSTSQTWHVHLNNGSGFEATPSLNIASPQAGAGGAQVADCRNPDFLRLCIDVPLSVPYPMIRSTRSVSNAGSARDTTQTEAGALDIDGDGIAEIARRVHIFGGDPAEPLTAQPRREGLLVWRRGELDGPQDLMVEDRFPVEGSRTRVEYRPASAFQWADARPDGQAPRDGHRPLAGLPGRLVRTVTTERLLGRDEQCTRAGYDYKLPYYDMASRSSSGFAVRSAFAFQPCPLAPEAAVAVGESLVETRRSAQRPDLLPGLTQVRTTVRGSGAPVAEALTSYAESAPVTRCPGTGSRMNADATAQCPLVGGLPSVFSAPVRSLAVEYPTGLRSGAVFDVGFDGREPLVDRATGRGPLVLAPVELDAQAATGGSMRLPAAALPYRSPHPASAMPPNPAIGEATVEAWLKPADAQVEEEVVEQVGAYRLGVTTANGARRWRLAVDGTPGLVSSGDADLVVGRWHHVVASFGPGGGRIFVDGSVVGEAQWTLAPGPIPTGGLLVACGSAPVGSTPPCFRGEIGELRVYREAWSVPPRVTDMETEVRIPSGCVFDPLQGPACPSDFGQALRVLRRNDKATPDDDVATELTYASPVPHTVQGKPGAPVAGLVSSQATRVLNRDGSLGGYLEYSERAYDGLAFGSAGSGNETKLSRFDGPASVTKPSGNQLRVRTSTEYGTSCPGKATRAQDPLGFWSETAWDTTCTFVTRLRNALGHVTSTRRYGVDYAAATFGLGMRSGPYGRFLLAGRYGQVAETVDPNGATTLATYDEWGRPVAEWSPLDRADRPGRRTEYQDALCETSAPNPFVPDPLPVLAACSATGVTVWLRSPARATTLTWDDQLRRCQDAAGKTVSCGSPAAARFLDETATGAYRLSYAFADGQTQAQTIRGGAPGWTLSGITDSDALGRLSRRYKVRYLPALDVQGEGPCLGPGVWCDSARAHGSPGGVDQLRTGVATIQLAYDARSRVVRTYGPGWPRCTGDPSALDGAGVPQCDAAVTPAGKGDVVKRDYPAPGDVRTVDANSVPSLVHVDARDLPTLFQEYVLSPAGTATPYSALRSTYDRMGRLEATSDEAGNVARDEYDALSRRTLSDDPDLGRTTFAYDLRSDLTERIAATGEKTVHHYDPIRRVVQTDYLVPHTVTEPGLPACCDPPGEGGLTWEPPDLCYEVPGLGEPTPVGPAPPGPPPPYALTPVPSGLELPFDMTLRANGPRESPGPQGFEGRDFRFAAGTPVSVGRDGTIVLGGSGRPGSEGTLSVFGADLVLDEGGLRFGTGGPEGSRSLTVEWEGVLASRPGEPVRVRAILGEGTDGVRYEFEQVPRDAQAVVGFRMGPEGAYGRTGGPGAGTPSWPPVASGTGIGFGAPLPARAFRLDCQTNRTRVVIPVDATGVENASLRLRSRVFSECGAPNGACSGELRIGGRKGADTELHELGRFVVSPRDLERSGGGEIADVFDVPLTPDLRDGKFDLVLDYAVRGGGRTLLDLASVTVQRTIWVPEERVYRSYDSSEPPYFVDSRAGGRRFETRPLLDLTFDVPEPRPPASPADRAPTHADFTCSRTPLESVLGASGDGAVIRAGATCEAMVAQAAVPRFAAELWVHPRTYPQQPQVILSAGDGFEVWLLPSGQVECRLGGTGASLTSDVVLPTEQDVATESGAWAHVAVSYDDAVPTLRCAVNGLSKAAPGAAGWARSLSPVRIGSLTSGADFEVDEVRLLPLPRSEPEMLQDALRPLESGPPRGNLVHLDFTRPADPGADASKAGNRASFTGTGNAATPTVGRLASGIQGMALDTGPGEQLTIPDPPGSTRLRLADALTGEVWVDWRQAVAGATDSTRLVGKWADEQHPGWRLDLQPDSGRIRWEVVTRFTDPAGVVSLRNEVFVTYETLSIGWWHHVAGTYDGARLRVFIDGVPAHRWCWTGPQEGSTPEGVTCTDPPKPQPCAVETRIVEVPPLKPGEARTRTIGDAACIQGSVDNQEPILVANDKAGPPLDGLIDEVRLSNYAKREFEVAASARLASAFTRSLGRETLVRNRLPVNPIENDVPFDLADLVSREATQFDLAGRAVSWLTRVRGQKSPEGVFRLRAAPDSAARNGLLEYPHGEVLAAGYALDGTETSLAGYGPGIGAAPEQRQRYVTAGSATLTGRPASQDLGNGLRTVWTYEDGPVSPATPGAPGGAFGPDTLKTAKVTSGAGVLSDRSYGWDLVGNLEFVRDAAGPFEASYGYDALRRVTSATLTLPGQPALAYSYAYDAIGNLTTKEGATQRYGVANAAAACRGSNPLAHAITQRVLGGVTDPYCYDAAGRLVRSVDTPGNSIRTYSYFARGKPSRLTDRNGTSTYAYDGNGLRVSKIETDGRAHVVPSPWFREISVPSTAQPPSYEATYSAGGQLVARRVLPTPAPPPTHPLWFSNDHLGGTLFITDATGAEVPGTRSFYRPFGEFHGTAPASDAAGRRQFTSKELDVSGLYDYGARPYDPATGRFTQADEVEPGASAQSRNRYSYVLNNPLIHIDPTGTTCRKAADGWICQFDRITPRPKGRLLDSDWEQIKQFEASYTSALHRLQSHPTRVVELTMPRVDEYGQLIIRSDLSGGITYETATVRLKAGDLAQELISRRFEVDFTEVTSLHGVGTDDRPAFAHTHSLPDGGVEKTCVGRLPLMFREWEKQETVCHECLHNPATQSAFGQQGSPLPAKLHQRPFDDAAWKLLEPGPDDAPARGVKPRAPTPAPPRPPVEKDMPDYSGPGIVPR